MRRYIQEQQKRCGAAAALQETGVSLLPHVCPRQGVRGGVLCGVRVSGDLANSTRIYGISCVEYKFDRL